MNKVLSFSTLFAIQIITVASLRAQEGVKREPAVVEEDAIGKIVSKLDKLETTAVGQGGLEDVAKKIDAMFNTTGQPLSTTCAVAQGASVPAELALMYKMHSDGELRRLIKEKNKLVNEGTELERERAKVASEIYTTKSNMLTDHEIAEQRLRAEATIAKHESAIQDLKRSIFGDVNSIKVKLNHELAELRNIALDSARHTEVINRLRAMGSKDLGDRFTDIFEIIKREGDLLEQVDTTGNLVSAKSDIFNNVIAQKKSEFEFLSKKSAEQLAKQELELARLKQLQAFPEQSPLRSERLDPLEKRRIELEAKLSATATAVQQKIEQHTALASERTHARGTAGGKAKFGLKILGDIAILVDFSGKAYMWNFTNESPSVCFITKALGINDVLSSSQKQKALYNDVKKITADVWEESVEKIQEWKGGHTKEPASATPSPEARE